ncbi:RNA polymerase-binding protein RbpA [Catellatospora sp. TT07R-123]|uniref:RNA polymerase-binding protein RbpA n=1 Tax=Catellatospora sp. TT07R-123 TaxID=2733863 RepID=UPI001B1F9DB9|nr:RNA polymerase-binding protein RbpA [Catellatospora sp. TT07R-123]GHJ47665.1 RNA polymerase-binding protein RbpA [Catellatospora sp. TT07R-123]
MAHRTLRGSRPGAADRIPVRETAFAARQTCEFRCANDHRFVVQFALDVEAPSTWDCKFDGSSARLVGGPEREPEHEKAARTPWDMLLQRRSIEDLEVLLAERLDHIRARRGS